MTQPSSSSTSSATAATAATAATSTTSNIFNFHLPSSNSHNNITPLKSKIPQSISAHSINSLESVPELSSDSTTSSSSYDLFNLSTPDRSKHNRGSSLTFFTPLNGLTASPSIIRSSRPKNLSITRSQSNGINPFYNPSIASNNNSLISPTKSNTSSNPTPLQTPSSKLHFDDASPFKLSFDENHNSGHINLNNPLHHHHHHHHHPFVVPKSKSFHGVPNHNNNNSHQIPSFAHNNSNDTLIDVYKPLDPNHSSNTSFSYNTYDHDSTQVLPQNNYSEEADNEEEEDDDFFTEDFNNKIFTQAANLTLQLASNQNSVIDDFNNDDNTSSTINPNLINMNNNQSRITRSEGSNNLASYVNHENNSKNDFSYQSDTPTHQSHQSQLSNSEANNPFYTDSRNGLVHSQSHPVHLSLSQPMNFQSNSFTFNHHQHQPHHHHHHHQHQQQQQQLQSQLSSSISTPNMLMQTPILHSQAQNLKDDSNDDDETDNEEENHHHYKTHQNYDNCNESDESNSPMSPSKLAAAAMFLPEGLDGSKLTIKKSKRSKKTLLSEAFNQDASSIKKYKKLHDCPLCGSKFQRPEHVKRHMRSHSSEKPYKCDQPNCGKRFNRNDNLKAHLRKIHKLQI